jgi:hypothetical protein
LKLLVDRKLSRECRNKSSSQRERYSQKEEAMTKSTIGIASLRRIRRALTTLSVYSIPECCIPRGNSLIWEISNNIRFSRQLGAQVQINSLTAGGTLLTITVLALFLRLHLLGQNSFWGDELASVRRAELDWNDFWQLMRGPPAMALYYALLRFWILLGDNEFTVRLLSVIPAVATVPIVYFLGKSLFDARVGLIAALLLSMNAFHLQYSQEARSYSLLVFLVTLSSLLLARGIQRPSWGNWMGYIVASALSVYAHPFAFLVLVAQVSSLVFLSRRDLPWHKLCLSGLALAIALLPTVAPTASGFIDPDTRADATSLSWIPEISLEQVHGFAVVLSGNDSDLLFIAYLIPIFVSSVAALRTWASTRASFESWKYALLLTWLFLPIIATLTYSFLIAPALVPRYLIICLPPLLILTAAGVWQIYRSLSVRRGPLGVSLLLVSGVLAAGLVVLSVRGTSAYYTEFVKEDWRGAAALIMSEWQPGDGILFYVPSTERMIQHYFERAQPGASEIRSLVPNGYPEKSPYIGQWHQFLLQEPNRERTAQYLPDHAERIWLVLARNWSSPSRTRVTKELQAALRAKYQDVQKLRSDGNPVRVQLYSNPIPGVFGGQWQEIGGKIELSKYKCRKLPVTIVGTNGNDQITGTEGDDVIHGLDGNDTINGLGGNDAICGGNGNDVLDGGKGNDTVNGMAGDDIVRGGPGNDWVLGSDGDDQLFGDDGDDRLNGGPGDDHLNGGQGDDVLNSGPGGDILDGGPGVDACQGRGSNQEIDCP